jgi:hypothetical protein
MVMAKYPVHPREATCYNTRERMKKKRELYAERLRNGKPEITINEN